MAYSRRPSRSPRSRTTLALLLLTAITLLVLDLPGTGPLDPIRGAFAAGFRPIRAAGDAVFEPFSNGWKGAFGYGDLKDENEQLKAKLEARKGQEAEIKRLQQDNADLRAINGVKIDGVKTKVAKVISGPLNSFEQTVEIDAGSSDGVKKGMAVVTGGGVLGRVTGTHAHTATVELITESGVVIGVATKEGDLAKATGQGLGKPLRVVGIEDDARMNTGDYLYTSGIDRSAFPGDLYVGRISKVGKSVDGIPRTIEVEPSADLTSRYVRVVLKDPPK